MLSRGLFYAKRLPAVFNSSIKFPSFTQSPYWSTFFRGFADDTSEWESTKPKKEIKGATAAIKTVFVAGPVKTVRAHVDKDKRSHRTGVAAVPEGTVGERFFEFVDPKAAHFPTIETLKEQFGGKPFEELPEVRIYLSKNNTKVVAVDYRGNVHFTTSASKEGFKNCKKKTEVSGQVVGFSTGNKCLRNGLTHVRLMLSGIGPGRFSCVQGITMTGVNIVSISDFSPLPELGPRPRKVRKL